MKRSFLNIASLALITAGTAFVSSPAAAEIEGASCTKTVENPDGSKVTVKIEGDTCSTDIQSGTCTCTSTA